MNCKLCGERACEIGYESEGLVVCCDCVEDISLTYAENILGLPLTSLDHCDFLLIAVYGYEAIKSLSPASKKKLFWAYKSKTLARES